MAHPSDGLDRGAPGRGYYSSTTLSLPADGSGELGSKTRKKVSHIALVRKYRLEWYPYTSYGGFKHFGGFKRFHLSPCAIEASRDERDTVFCFLLPQEISAWLYWKFQPMAEEPSS